MKILVICLTHNNMSRAADEFLIWTFLGKDGGGNVFWEEGALGQFSVLTGN